MRMITVPTTTVRTLALGSVAAALCVSGAAPALAGDTTVRLCHALDADTGETGWESRTVAAESVFGNASGHVDQHDADIIPAFTYLKDGVTREFAGKNWSGSFLEIHANGCVAPTGQGNDEDPSDPVVEEDPSDPVVEEDPTDPVVEEDPTDPVVEEDPTDPVVEEDPSHPVAEEDPSHPVAEEDPTDPVVEEDRTDPLVKDERASAAPRVVRTLGSPVPRLRTVVSTMSTRSWNGNRLPRTGIEMETLVGGAGLLLLAGAVAVVATRRRPEDES